MKTEIIFRADGNSKIGLGHAIRCLALAEMIKDEFTLRFVTIAPSDFLIAQVHKHCDQLNVISSEQEFMLMAGPGKIIVLDGYQYTSEFMQEIIDRGAKLVYIDDLHDRFYPAHAIVNHNPGIKQSDYTHAAYTRLLLGLDFALLRKPFLESAKKKPAFRSATGKLLISMGGADPNNFTQLALDAALQTNRFAHITIIAGPAMSARLVYPEKVNVLSNLDAEQMSAVMLEHEMLIAPASSVCMEGLATGLKIICGYYERNQQDFYEYMSAHQLVYGIGNMHDAGLAGFISAFNGGFGAFDSLEANPAIDGNQAARFIEEFKCLTN